jgi:hypothetical protein
VGISLPKIKQISSSMWPINQFEIFQNLLHRQITSFTVQVNDIGHKFKKIQFACIVPKNTKPIWAILMILNAGYSRFYAIHLEISLTHSVINCNFKNAQLTVSHMCRFFSQNLSKVSYLFSANCQCLIFNF